MTTVLLAGLSDHDAAAMEILISSHWREKRCVWLKRKAGFTLPTQSAQAAGCAKVVADLGGMGLHPYSAENAAKLKAFLAGRPALLLTWKNDGGWGQAAAMAAAPDQPLALLAAPYSSAQVKAALAELDAAPVGQLPRAALADRSKAAMPVEKSALALPAPALLDVLPALKRSRFVRLVEQLPAAGGVQVLHIGATELLVHPTEAWVGASVPVSAPLRVRGSSSQLETARLEPLSGLVAAQIEQHITSGKGQRYMLALDVVLWDLCSRALEDVEMQLQGGAMFKLGRFPNFTLLGQVGALDIQLAALCIRQAQSVRALQRLFPKQEGQVLRFVALAVLTGLGQLQTPPLDLSAGAAGKPVKTEHTREHKERRGFLRSLLDKLF